jgi:hypothetical protein
VTIRATADRVADAQQRLQSDPNVWVATASPDGLPHLVPFSLGWDGTDIQIATPRSTVTARNVTVTGRARASLDDADDVVILDGPARVQPIEEVEGGVLAEFIQRLGWDPADNGDDWVLITLTPERVLSWNSLDQGEGRVIMRNGAWLP